MVESCVALGDVEMGAMHVQGDAAPASVTCRNDRLVRAAVENIVDTQQR